MNFLWRRKKVVGGAAVGVIAATAVIVGTVGGPEDVVMPDMGADGRGRGALIMDLQARRDFGALVPRGTGDGQWCGAADGLAAPAHCWELQQSSGDATDYGAVGGWHLTPQGSPRAGVATGLPVEGSGAVDWTSETAAWSEADADYYSAGAQTTLSGTNLLSVSFVAATHTAKANAQIVWHEAGNIGYRIYYSPTKIFGFVRDGSTTASVASAMDPHVGWQCVTVVLDGRTSGAGKIYVNGEDDTSGTNDLSGMGTWGTSAAFRVLGLGSSNFSFDGGVARLRRDDQVAVTLAQHRALCGSWGLPVASTHRVASDMTWTQSGGARCYPSSATAATCYPGGVPAARWTATGWEWAVDGQGATNRLLWSNAMDCSTWSCIGVASGITGQVAPDGSATASTITVAGGANHFEQDIASGYTADASPLHLSLWAKCSTGVFHPHGSNDGTRGDWDVSCSCIGGVWRLLDASDGCVTVNVPFNAGSGGESGLHFDGTLFPLAVDIWAPTLTEEPTTGAVIPTAAAAVSTGAIAWSVDNSSSEYWLPTSTVTQSVSTVDGTCVVPGSTFWLGGDSPGLECVGGVYSVQVRR